MLEKVLKSHGISFYDVRMNPAPMSYSYPDVALEQGLNWGQGHSDWPRDMGVS